MEGKPVYAVGLDAGSLRTRFAIGVLEPSGLRLIGLGESESEGWVKGRIADQRAASDSILRAVREAEAMAQVTVESAVAGMGGPTVRGANSRAAIEVGRKREIEARDVARVIDHASRVQLHEDRMLLQALLQDFVVDDHPGHRDPRGMVASRVEANMHLITASTQEHDCLVTAMNQAHLAAEETVHEGLAACYAAILPDERREGIALLDIGVHSSELAVYYGESLQLASSIPICGDHFTRDVARGLCTTYEDGVRLKEEYGCAVLGLTGDHTLIEVPSSEDRGAREAPRRLLNNILEARAEELFRLVRRELARVGMDQALMGGIVLCGGGSRLNGMCDMAERVLNCNARNGLALGIQDWPDEIDDPVWATVAGLMMFSAKLKARNEAQQRAVGFLGRMLR
ncbi:MAG TPA: cell division protein FtsA [Bryobacteraceae bacterium]|jgi:cell division protein FtsA|nr:cell division protein FtsA [Bryobacteraceae bacterium]